jgi:Glycosyl hydrolase family 12
VRTIRHRTAMAAGHRRLAGRPRATGLTLALAGVMATGVLSTGLAGSSPAVLAASAVSAPAAPVTTRMCQPAERATVVNRTGRWTYFVRNDVWGSTAMCVSIHKQRPNFTVSLIGRNILDGRVEAFPDIFTGCGFAGCTAHSILPRRVRSLARTRPATKWQTRQPHSGIWNAAYDIWFSKTSNYAKQANGAELMIWIGTRGLGRPGRSWPVLKIDGARWYLLHWRTCERQKGTPCWNYIQFRRVRPVASASLRLMPFIRAVERRHLVLPRWWLLRIMAGFEIWRGGKGLATKWFWARA